MTLKELTYQQYDILCENKEQVKEVVAVLEKNGVKEWETFLGDPEGTAIALYEDDTHKIVSINRRFGRYTISGTDFLNLPL